MKFAEVTDQDMKLFAQVINMLQVGKFELGGKELCAAGDAIRWLQRVAVGAAEAYSGAKTSAKPVIQENKPEEIMPQEPVKSGFPEGVKIKAFNPGKIGRGK